MSDRFNDMQLVQHMEKEKEFMKQVTQDVIDNNCSFSVLEYVEKNYHCSVEIGHEGKKNWTADKYNNSRAKGKIESDEIRIEFGHVYQYINVNGDRSADRNWNDSFSEYKDNLHEGGIYNTEQLRNIPEYVTFEEAFKTINTRMEEEQNYVKEIIDDIRDNDFSWEVLEYVNGNYAEVEIDHKPISDWDKNSYERCVRKGDMEFDEIRVNFGTAYSYVNIYGETDKDHSENDTVKDFDTATLETLIPEYQKFDNQIEMER